MSNFSKNNEFEELLSLAESSSNNTKIYMQKIDKLKFNFFVYNTLVVFLFASVFGFTYFYFLSNHIYIRIEYLIFVGVLISTIYCLLFFNYSNQIRKYRNELNIENDILKRLLDLIYEFLEVKIYNNQFSTVEIAIIEMKLSRISFATPFKDKFYNRLHEFRREQSYR